MTTTIPGPAITCPDWCDLPQSHHDIDLQNGRALVDHDGPKFGPFLHASGVTFAETGEVAVVEVRLFVDAVPPTTTPRRARRS